MTRSDLRLSLIVLTLASSAACGWFASSGDEVYLSPEEVEGAGRPTCRPKDADPKAKVGTAPWSVGDATPGGWTVTAVDADHPEFVRVTFDKEGTASTLEIAYSDGTVGDWSTAHHKLMPAPSEEPPADLLDEAMAQLRAYDASADAKPFVQRVEGVEDPYDGLPPCE